MRVNWGNVAALGFLLCLVAALGYGFVEVLDAELIRRGY